MLCGHESLSVYTAAGSQSVSVLYGSVTKCHYADCSIVRLPPKASTWREEVATPYVLPGHAAAGCDTQD